jgi:hypothetical protein
MVKRGISPRLSRSLIANRIRDLIDDVNKLHKTEKEAGSRSCLEDLVLTDGKLRSALHYIQPPKSGGYNV